MTSNTKVTPVNRIVDLVKNLILASAETEAGKQVPEMYEWDEGENSVFWLVNELDYFNRLWIIFKPKAAAHGYSEYKEAETLDKMKSIMAKWETEYLEYAIKYLEAGGSDSAAKVKKTEQALKDYLA